MKYTLISSIATLSLFFVSCDNPADSTADAEVNEPQEAAEAAIEARAYRFTPESTISFIGSKVTGSHSGEFKSFTGGFKVLDGTPVSGNFTIDMDSTVSDNEKLTAHLKNEDFFNVSKFPKSNFVVTGFEETGTDTYNVSGNLTMLDVTKNITFPASVLETAESITLTSEFDINRKDWGIVFKGKPDDLIRDEVVLKLNLIATPKG